MSENDRLSSLVMSENDRLSSLDMSENDRCARIRKKPFLASIVLLCVITIVAVCARLVIRVRYQKTLLIDDGFLLFGIACLIASVGFLYVFVDQMYLLHAISTGNQGFGITKDDLSQLFDYQKWACICGILLWSSISAVKFSFLFLFRKLIDRIRWMIIYWRIVTVFCVIVWLYGIASYILACPWFYSARTFGCARASGLQRVIISSSLQMSLDAVSDFLILFIPVRLIWKIQVRWTQKLALGLTLCLTIFLITITLVRASGLTYRGYVDNVWEIYLQFISAEVGLILTSLSAFRTLFVAHPVQNQPELANRPSYIYNNHLLCQLTRSLTWGRRKSRENTETTTSASDAV